jgi:hypothetical protein
MLLHASGSPPPAGARLAQHRLVLKARVLSSERVELDVPEQIRFSASAREQPDRLVSSTREPLEQLRPKRRNAGAGTHQERARRSFQGKRAEWAVDQQEGSRSHVREQLCAAAWADGERRFRGITAVVSPRDRVREWLGERPQIRAGVDDQVLPCTPAKGRLSRHLEHELIHPSREGPPREHSGDAWRAGQPLDPTPAAHRSEPVTCYARPLMNFFGHAAIAGRFETHPAFVLGAMLPDFFSMLGLEPFAPTEGKLGAGIRFHHLTDHAFHDLPVFRGLCRESTAFLDERRVRRGTARAAAHVGVELMLDAELAESAESRTLYLAALNATHEPALLADAPLSADARDRLGRLTGTLAERGVAKRPDDGVVVERLERALARRPRLLIVPEDLPSITSWVEVFRERVVACSAMLVNELTRDIERRLAARPPSIGP